MERRADQEVLPVSPRRTLARRLTDEQRTKFFGYLDRLPAKDRPVFAFSGQKPSLTQRLGGGTRYVVVVVFPDHVVFSTRDLTSTREVARESRLLAEIESITVTAGTLMSRATFRFVGGATTKLANVSHAEAGPLARFDGAGLAAFDRSGLSPEAVTAFFVACSHALALPDGLFAGPD
jgi:hypothetical protein